MTTSFISGNPSANAEGLLRTKLRLKASFVHSTTFSAKYRLLGDYVEVLRNQLGIVRVELAEDLEELKEDR